MKTAASVFNSKQLLFKELFVGTLIYAVVLGFFNDYTTIVYAKSFSSLFFASIVLELLTYLVLLLKSRIVARLKDGSVRHRLVMVFAVWFIMFVSKFVFIWAIDAVFGNYVNIQGFFGILWVVLSVTLIHKLADTIFMKLGEGQNAQ